MRNTISICVTGIPEGAKTSDLFMAVSNLAKRHGLRLVASSQGTRTYYELSAPAYVPEQPSGNVVTLPVRPRAAIPPSEPTPPVAA